METRFTQALALHSPWRVVSVDFRQADGIIVFEFDNTAQRLACPACGAADPRSFHVQAIIALEVARSRGIDPGNRTSEGGDFLHAEPAFWGVDGADDKANCSRPAESATTRL